MADKAAPAMPLQLIDISKFDPETNLEESKIIARNVLSACTDTGFLVIQGHGVPQQMLDEMFALAKEYYLTQDYETEKKPFTMGKDHIGYVGIGGQTLDPSGIPDNKELFNFAKFGPQHPLGTLASPHPTLFQKHWTSLETHSHTLHELGLRILRILALALEIPEEEGGWRYFDKLCGYDLPSGDTYRFLHYPPPADAYGRTGAARTEEEQRVRIGAHTDWGAVTCLFQDSTGGLQIRLPPRYPDEPEESRWTDIPPIPGGMICNLGDLIQYWTSGFLKSTMHRVCPSPIPENRNNRRFAVAYFLRPGFDTPMGPIPSPMLGKDTSLESTDTMAPKTKPLTAGEWLHARALKSFTKAGELPSGY